jgi:hypothetical protein
MTTILPVTNPIITFNVDSHNYPKFEIHNNPHIFIVDDIKIIIFTELVECIQWTTIINSIINYYNEIQDIHYIMQYLDVPFSFLLIDLNIYRPQYKIFLVIQSYDYNIYYKSYSSGSMEISMKPSMEGSIMKKVVSNENTVLKWGKIHLFTLNEKVKSQWKYNETDIVDISYSPPFYITHNDFFNFVTSEKINGAPVHYCRILLDILLSVSSLPLSEQYSAILYNYGVDQGIKSCKFSLDEYNANVTLIKFYLLIYHELRFTERYTIIDFLRNCETPVVITGVDNV